MIIQSHLKSILTNAVSLIRQNRTLGLPTTSLSQILSEQSASKIPDDYTLPASATSGLTTCDFSSLFDIAPHLLVKSHVGAVEKLYALAPPSDASSSDASSSDSDDRDSDSEAEGQLEVVDGGKKSRKIPITAGVRPVSGSTNNVDNVSVVNVGLGGANGSTKIRSRNPSRYNSLSTSSGTGGAGGGREQYLIDPSATSIPLGHPDVSPHPLPVTSPHPSQGGPSRRPSLINLKSAGNGGGVGTGGGTSPNSIALRLQLFPELDSTSTTSPSLGGGVLDELVQSPNSTSSDEGSDEEEEEEGNATMVGMGTGMIPPGGGGGRNSISAAGGNPAGNGVGGSSARKLWEVVDSHRLLNDLI